MRGDRTVGPSRMLCKDCALDVAPTDLSRAEHRARHLEWAAYNGKPPHPTPDQRREAWRSYSKALEQLACDLREQIATRDEIISELEADYAHILTELQAIKVTQ